MSDLSVLKIELSETFFGALLVLSGEYGVNPERKEKLELDGFNAKRVQECVNDLVRLSEKYAD